jgi:GPH family glycoside/pentoside/hexuronide:cation symporter
VNRPSTLICAAYAAPALALAALYFPVFVYLAPFYAEGQGVALAAIGALFIGVRLIDAVTDPMMGWLSDHTPPALVRFGRRRVWLAVATPVIAGSIWMLFSPPAGAGIAYMAVWLTLLTLGWTIAQTPYYAWGAEMSGDYDTRARVTSWREGTGLVGVTLAILLVHWAGDGLPGLWAVAAMVCVTLPIGVATALTFAPEPRNFSRQSLGIREASRAIAGNTLFRRLLAAYFINGLANALPAGLFVFYIRDLLQDPDSGFLILIYFVCAVIGLPLWSKIAAHTGSKHRTWGAAMIYASVIFIPAAFLEAGDTAIFAVICVLTGLALGADLALPAAIQADVVDLDTAETGEQRTGVYFAIWSLATKAALAIGGGVALIILGSVDFQTNAENDDTALTTLAMLYALAPAVLKLIAVAIMWNFPLDRTKQADLRSRIEA